MPWENARLGLDFDSDISSGDREKARLGKAKLEEAIAVCRDCGGEYIGGILHSAFGKYAKPTETKKLYLSCARLPKRRRKAASPSSLKW